MLQTRNCAASECWEPSTQEERDLYGIDWDGPLPSETWGSLTHDGDIVVPQTDITIPHDQFVLLQENINPLGQTENYGIDIYENTVDFVQNVLSTPNLQSIIILLNNCSTICVATLLQWLILTINL